MKGDAMSRRRHILAAAALALCGALTLESFLPPERQPTAAACVGAIRGYQALGSPAMEAAGVRCRYTPTCSHYAAAAISHYGTMEGLVRTAGRLWRCSPWGGTGHDPAVASRSRRPLQQETPEERKAREEAEKKFREDAQKAAEEVRKALQEGAPQAVGACAAGCVVTIITGLVGLAIWIFMIVYVLKDGKSRGDPNAVLWVVLIVFFHVIGFVIYMVARPKGDLAPCANCKNRRLETLAKCPHCGADAAGGAKA